MKGDAALRIEMRHPKSARVLEIQSALKMSGCRPEDLDKETLQRLRVRAVQPEPITVGRWTRTCAAFMPGDVVCPRLTMQTDLGPLYIESHSKDCRRVTGQSYKGWEMYFHVLGLRQRLDAKDADAACVEASRIVAARLRLIADDCEP